MSKMPAYARFSFSLQTLADFIAEYLEDGKRADRRDVLDWFDWFERSKCRVRKSHIISLQRRHLERTQEAKA